MSVQRELELLIKNEVLVEINSYIVELTAMLSTKDASINVKEELAQMEEMKKDFEEMLTDLIHGDIDDDEAKDIIEEIREMRKEEE